MTASSLPLSARDLTTEWLSGVLREAIGADAQVHALAVEPIESGAVSDTFRLRAEVRNADGVAPLHLIVKLPSSNAELAAASRAAGLFQAEVDFYLTRASRLAIATPRCYVARIDASGLAVVVLEDLDLEPTLAAGDIGRGCSRAQAEGVLRALAALHQPSAFQQLAPETRPLPFMHFALQRRGPGPREARWARWLESRGESVGPNPRRVGEALTRSAVPAFVRIGETSPVLLHGDCKADNMFFRANGDPVMFDWQLACRGAGAFDVAFFLSTSIAPEMRRELEATQLRAYHADAAVPISYDAWFELYRHCINVAFYRTTTSLALHSSGKASARALQDTVVQRQAVAIDDLRTHEIVS